LPTYRVREWEKHFENSESRKVKNLAWVPVKNKHDGAGYRRVAALPNSVQVFCGWSLIVQVASRMPTRGVLRDDDGALDPADLAAKTGYPESVFRAAFEALTHPKIRWLELDGESPSFSTPPGRAGKFPDAPGDSGVEQKGTEGKGTEQNEGVSSRPRGDWPDKIRNAYVSVTHPGSSLAAILQSLATHKPEVMLQGTRECAAAVRKKEQAIGSKYAFTPNPETFFGEELWLEPERFIAKLEASRGNLAKYAPPRPISETKGGF
jgi:hypothetical protein